MVPSSLGSSVVTINTAHNNESVPKKLQTAYEDAISQIRAMETSGSISTHMAAMIIETNGYESLLEVSIEIRTQEFYDFHEMAAMSQLFVGLNQLDKAVSIIMPDGNDLNPTALMWGVYTFIVSVSLSCQAVFSIPRIL